MIQISLLPQNERKGKMKMAGAPGAASASGGAVASLAVLMFAAIAFGAVGATGYYSWNQVHLAKQDFQKLDAEKRLVDAEVASLSAKAHEIKEMREVLTNQWEVLQSLDPPERILWSEKINMLSDLMPSSIFLTEVKLTENVVEVEIQASIDARTQWEADGRKGPQPEVVKKPVITHTLSLSGVATGADNNEQIANVIAFDDALHTHEYEDAQGTPRRFMDHFNPTIGFEPIQSELYEGVAVTTFTFIIQSAPLAETAATTATAQSGL